MAFVQLKFNALVAFGQDERGVQFAGGALDTAACHLHGVAVAHDAQGLAGGAQGIENLAGYSGNFSLGKNDLVIFAVLNGLDNGVKRDRVIVARGIVAIRAGGTIGGIRSGAVDNDGDHGGSLTVGNCNGSGACAYRRDHARRTDRGNAAVGRLVGELLRCRRGGGFCGEGAGGTGLQHHIRRGHGNDLTAVGRA